MKKIQVYPRDEELEALQQVAKRSGKDIAELVRETGRKAPKLRIRTDRHLSPGSLASFEPLAPGPCWDNLPLEVRGVTFLLRYPLTETALRGM